MSDFFQDSGENLNKECFKQFGETFQEFAFNSQIVSIRLILK